LTPPLLLLTLDLLCTSAFLALMPSQHSSIFLDASSMMVQYWKTIGVLTMHGIDHSRTVVVWLCVVSTERCHNLNLPKRNKHLSG
jgi:hypothetical protein